MERAKSKERARIDAAQVRIAEQGVGKLQPVLTSIDALMNKPAFDLLGATLKEPITKAATRFSELKEAAEAIVGGGGGECPFDVKTLATEIANLKKNMTLCTSMMAAFSKIRQ